MSTDKLKPKPGDFATLNNQELLDRIVNAEKKLEKQNDLMTFGLIVLLIMVATILIDVWLSKQQSYEDLQTQIYQLNAQKRQRP